MSRRSLAALAALATSLALACSREVVVLDSLSDDCPAPALAEGGSLGCDGGACDSGSFCVDED